MPKSVRFSEGVDVFYTGLSLKEHSSEVKNPLITIFNGETEPKSRGGNKVTSPSILRNLDRRWWYIIGVFFLCLLGIGYWWFFHRKKSLGKSETEE